MNNTTPARLTSGQRAWLEHLNAWREQGGSLKAYAAAHDLSISALYTARRLLVRGGAWPGRVAAAPPPTFLAVRVRPSATPLRVVLPNGVVIELPEHGDVGQAAALIAALGQRRP